MASAVKPLPARLWLNFGCSLLPRVPSTRKASTSRVEKAAFSEIAFSAIMLMMISSEPSV